MLKSKSILFIFLFLGVIVPIGLAVLSEPKEVAPDSDVRGMDKSGKNLGGPNGKNNPQEQFGDGFGTDFADQGEQDSASSPYTEFESPDFSEGKTMEADTPRAFHADRPDPVVEIEPQLSPGPNSQDRNAGGSSNSNSTGSSIIDEVESVNPIA